MKVIAHELGFYNGRRRAGDVFDVPAGTKAAWFSPAETGEPKPEAPAPKARTAPRRALLAEQDGDLA